MKRTNEQVIKFCERVLRRYWYDNEKIRERCGNYWQQYNLTPAQTEILDYVNRNLKMPPYERTGWEGVWV